MKQKIEALSNAFNIGFEFGDKPYNGNHTNSTKAALKKAIEDGLKMMSSKPCKKCWMYNGCNGTYLFCPQCGRKINNP